nr:RNA-directed DNA polymerase, eukaryota, reverse transcriptase zinc-binding domain protein [Tanacetum cinerariifolium]
MRLAVSIEKVEEVTRHIGCGILNTPFSFLGSKVGGCMSRKSWDEVIDKTVNRLSKWKMKTLSIGGWLTLLKAVFGSMPIFHMSIFKVPMLVLQHMESIRCHFFNGNVLDSKRDSLWVRVIHGIHGVDGRIGRAGNAGYTSIWCDIIKEIDRLASHEIDLITEGDVVIPLDEIQLDDKLHMIKEPVEVVDREVKQLRKSRIPIVKVSWNSQRGPKYTWECEDQIKKKYPHIFTSKDEARKADKSS